MKRECGECTLCCRLMPVKTLQKPANTKCRHQRFRTGCAIYSARPMECKMWKCRWLAEPDSTSTLRRPDHAHYVIDMMPDYVTFTYPDKPDQRMLVIQVWCDPRFPDAHHDPALREILESNQVAMLVRYDAHRAMIVAPPSVTGTGDWYEGGVQERGVAQHSLDEIMKVIDATNALHSDTS